MDAEFIWHQTDVFLIDNDGQLNVFWVDDSGAWQGPDTIGPAGFAPPYSPLAVSQQFDQTNVFLVDKNGQLSVFSVESAGPWQGPQKIGPAGFTGTNTDIYPLAVTQQPGQTSVFLVDKNGQVNVFWQDGAGPWQGPHKITPPTNGVAPAASPQFGTDQTDVFVVDEQGVLNVYWGNGAGPWHGPDKICEATLIAYQGSPLAASPQLGRPNQTDVFVVDGYGQLNVVWVEGSGPWQGPDIIGPNPASGQYAPQGVTYVTPSPQFGRPDQTDIFLVDYNQQLNVLWVEGAGKWQGPDKIGPPNFAPAGCLVAASPRVGRPDQTDVFLVDNNGQLNAFWVEGAGKWQGPQKIGPEKFAPRGSLVVAAQQYVARKKMPPPPSHPLG